jgi:alkylhydroperoxidase/carboxymuconolactone decarboxylase family protein YurZ
MADETKEFFEKFKNDVAKMKQHIPDAVNGFAGLFSKVMQDGALSLREKELVALGIAFS